MAFRLLVPEGVSPWIYALLSAGLIWFGATLFLLASAFRTSLKWGFLSLLVPFGILVFTIKYWRVAGTCFLVVAAGYLAFVAIFVTHLDAIVPYLPPPFAPLVAALRLPAAPDMSPAAEPPAKAAASAQAEVQLNQRDELLAREAAYNQHFAAVDATYAQLTAARAKLKGGGPALTAFNARVAQYQQSLTRVQAEKTAYDALQRTVSAADAADKAARQKVAGLGFPTSPGFTPTTNGAAPASADTPATRADLDAAVARIRAIVNQVPPVVTKPKDAESWHSGFHPGATKPDFDHTDIVSGREAYPGPYMSMDGVPGVFYLSAQCEFNSQTKFFYTNRQLPKKKLSDAEYQELVRLYRFVGKCQRDLNVSL